MSLIRFNDLTSVLNRPVKVIISKSKQWVGSLPPHWGSLSSAGGTASLFTVVYWCGITSVLGSDSNTDESDIDILVYSSSSHPLCHVVPEFIICPVASSHGNLLTFVTKLFIESRMFFFCPFSSCFLYAIAITTQRDHAVLYLRRGCDRSTSLSYKLCKLWWSALNINMVNGNICFNQLHLV